MTKNYWLGIRKLLDQLESVPEFKATDRISRQLLDWIYIQAQNEKPIFVQTIVMKSEIASPATIYKSLALLERSGLISTKIDPEDSRRRIIKPTERTNKLMVKLSRDVLQWAKAND
jgi:DNA-binding MarR family transcriptional regulator